MTNSTTQHLNRRSVLAGGALLPAVATLASSARATDGNSAGDDFTYEVVRSEDGWKARLTDLEYKVMRQGGTEPRHTSLLAFENREGSYRCKGCDLTAFDSEWKVNHFDIGWVFFQQARTDTILTDVDLNFGMMEGDEVAPSATIECHCRRCGSHLGHILNVRGEVLHCLNGEALVFSPV